MGWLFSSTPKWTEKDLDKHERSHLRAYKDQKIRYTITNRGGIPVLEGRIPHSKSGSRRGAIALYAGYLAGGGDRQAALELAREAGMTEQEVAREARKYV